MSAESELVQVSAALSDGLAILKQLQRSDSGFDEVAQAESAAIEAQESIEDVIQGLADGRIPELP